MGFPILLWSQGNQPPPPPDMIPPPPPDIQPPSLPPDFVPPRMQPPPDPIQEDKAEPFDDFETPEARELVRLEQFLRMPRERLTQIRIALERVENMSDREKDQLLARIEELKEMTRQRRREFFHNFQGLNREQRRGLTAIYYSASSEEKKAIREKLSQIEDESERRTFVDLLLEENKDRLEALRKERQNRQEIRDPIQMRRQFRAPGEDVPPLPTEKSD